MLHSKEILGLSILLICCFYSVALEEDQDLIGVVLNRAFSAGGNLDSNDENLVVYERKTRSLSKIGRSRGRARGPLHRTRPLNTRGHRPHPRQNAHVQRPDIGRIRGRGKGNGKGKGKGNRGRGGASVETGQARLYRGMTPRDRSHRLAPRSWEVYRRRIVEQRRYEYEGTRNAGKETGGERSGREDVHVSSGQESDSCPVGWTGHRDVCYLLMPHLLTFETANQKCQELDARLVAIETEQENDFLSSWLMALSAEAVVWTAGAKRAFKTGLRWQWQEYYTTLNHTAWFPGFPPNEFSRQPSNRSGESCIALSRQFYRRHGHHDHIQLVHRYYWDDVSCNRRLPYVCQRLARPHDHGDCYHGRGQLYRGEAQQTRKSPCLSWVGSAVANPQTHPGMGLGDHNYCRNPDNDTKPWCWVDHSSVLFGYCLIPACGDLVDPGQTTMTPTTTGAHHSNSSMGIGTSVNSTSCNVDQFQCSHGTYKYCIPRRWMCDGEDDCLGGLDEVGCEPTEPEQTTETLTTTTAAPVDRTSCSASELRCTHGAYEYCIPRRWMCDGEDDCLDGFDEVGCVTPLDEFRPMDNYNFLPLAPSANVSYYFLSDDQCAKRCLDSRTFVCRAFTHVNTTDGAICQMYNVSATQVGGLASIEGSTYFELVSQTVNCTVDELFLCDNGKCINRTDVCNDYDNCNDYSDEANCAEVAAPVTEVSVRLVGGDIEREGRVEVRYLGEWGVVCDDDWDMQDAQVVCRQLGYGEALRVSRESEFGAGSANFLLDDVNCSGTETSLLGCAHPPWRQHDCFPSETAGVACASTKDCHQYRCPSGECVLLAFVCDGANDCSDGSDERHCQDPSVSVELVGGRTAREGRVELIRYGVRGTVCDDAWDDLDAAVICDMLGYRGTATAFSAATFGIGSGVIWLDQVECYGNESDITTCRHRTWGFSDCFHFEDAGVRCGDIASTTPVTTTVSMTTSLPTGGVGRTCGRRPVPQMMARVVGGQAATRGAYPWQVGVRRRASGSTEFGGWCGGTVLSQHWILSAAHCYHNRDKEQFRVRVGDHDNTRFDIYEREFELEEIISHPRYSARTHDYDLALLKVKDGSRIAFNTHVQPACLAAAATPYTADTLCEVSGWGSTGWAFGHEYPSRLQMAKVPLMDQELCGRLYKNRTTDRMFCAGYKAGNVDSCQGDSGGPLVCQINGHFTVLGAVSWGIGCAHVDSPGVYAKVSSFAEWIRTYTGLGETQG